MARVSSAGARGLSRDQDLPLRRTLRSHIPDQTRGILCGSQYCRRVISKKSKRIPTISRDRHLVANRSGLRVALCERRGIPGRSYVAGPERSAESSSLSQLAAISSFRHGETSTNLHQPRSLLTGRAMCGDYRSQMSPMSLLLLALVLLLSLTLSRGVAARAEVRV